MKKFFLSAMLAIVSLACFAQGGEALKFLGIPIDGKESVFASKLKEKGFTYNSDFECYHGEFNGRNVDVRIHTHHGLVDRVFVTFPNTTESNIKIEFNRLLSQFENNSKYTTLLPNEKIPEDEDISYEMSVHNKRYQASFNYFAPRDDIAYFNAFVNTLAGILPDETIAQLKEDAASASTDEERNSLLENFKQEVSTTLAAEYSADPEKGLQLLLDLLARMESLADGSVWFMISEFHGKYYICLYYDNLHNKANGDDL